jgi:hypothetical protein
MREFQPEDLSLLIKGKDHTKRKTYLLKINDVFASELEELTEK